MAEDGLYELSGLPYFACIRLINSQKGSPYHERESYG